MHEQYLSRDEKLLLKGILCLRSHRNKYYSVITKQMNFNCPIIETSESIESHENNLELNAITCLVSEIF